MITTDTVHGAGRIYDRIIEGILLALLTYLPFAYGGVLPISHVVLMVGAAAMGVCFALRCLLVRETEVVWTWAYVPAALFIGLVAFQLVPLEMDTLAAIAPGNAEVWSNLTGTANGMPAEPEKATVSLYPWATKVNLRLLLSVGMILLVASNVLRRAGAVRRLLLGVSIIGLAVALLALVQDLSGTHAIYWAGEPRIKPVMGGPFVHRGHFCEFINLSMGAALALLLMRAADRWPGKTLKLEAFRGLERADRVLLGFLILGAVTVGLSQSRNGLMALLLGAAVTVAIMQRSRFVIGIGWPLIGLVLAGFVALLFLGFDPIYERLTTAEDVESAYMGRYRLVRDTLSMFSSFPVLGAGQGTYEVVFPMFDESMRGGTAAHAENLYVEVLAETGWVGAGLVGLFVLLVGWAWRRLALRNSALGAVGKSTRAVGFGIGFGLFAMAMNSVTDFGLILPAVMTLGVVLMGVLLGLGVRRTLHGAPARVICALFGLAGSGLLVAQLPDAVVATTARAHWDSVDDFLDVAGPLPESEVALRLDDAMRAAQVASELQPHNIDYRHWAVVHEWSRDFDREVLEEESADGEPTEGMISAARQAQTALINARFLAPTYGPLWSVLGQLGTRWLSEPDAGRWIHLGQELAPHHPATNLASAVQLLAEGREEEAVARFARADRMGARLRGIVEILVNDLGEVEMARELTRGRLQDMIQLERLLQTRAQGEDDDEGLAELQAEIVDELEEACAGHGPAPWMLVRLADHQVSMGADEEAVTLYQRVLTRVPDSKCRYNLALAHVRLGKLPEARMQLLDLLKIHPQHSGGQQLLDSLLGR